MQQERVLLRKGDDGGWYEVGRVIESHGKTLSLKLPDGSTVEHERSRDELTPSAGSLVHLARVAPDVVPRTLDQNPALIFKQVLHEAGKALRATELKQRLRDVAGDRLNFSWEAARQLLADAPEVTMSKSNPPTYAFRGDSVPAFATLFPMGRPATAGDDDDDTVPTLVPRLPDGPDSPSIEHTQSSSESWGTEFRAGPEASDGPQVERPPSVEPPRDVPVPMARAGDPAQVPAETPRLVSALATLLPRVGIRTLDDVAVHLLEVGDRVSKLTAQEQSELVLGISAAERRLLAMACGPAKQGLLEPQVRELTVGDYRAAIDAAIREILRAENNPRPLKTAAEKLLERAQETGDLPVELLVRVGRCFAQQPPHPAGLTKALEAAAAQVRRLDDVATIRTWDLDALARTARAAPFARSGGRTALVAAVYARDPDEGVHGRWWENAGLAELAEGGRGLLARALEDERVSSAVVDPLLAQYLKEATTRAAVATLWTLPQPVASRASGEQVARLLSGLGQRDQVVSAWLSTLTSQARFIALEDEVADLRSRLGTQDETVASLTQQVERLREQLRRAGEQLAVIRQAESSQRGARDRQLRVDLVRTLAVLLAQVQQSQSATSDTALMRQVQHLSRREGLEPIGQVGQEQRFDPAEHEALTPGLVPGTSVTVARCGYTWESDGEQVVLLKAQVVSHGG